MVRTQPPMTNLCAGYSDSLYRNRLQALLGVDAMVEAVADYLLAAGKLDSTFFVYTSDHGPAASLFLGGVFGPFSNFSRR